MRDLLLKLGFITAFFFSFADATFASLSLFQEDAARQNGNFGPTLNQKWRPDVLDKLKQNEVTSGPLYFDNPPPACRSFYESVCDRKPPKDSTGANHPYLDLEFTKSVNKENSLQMHEVFQRWAAIPAENRPPQDRYIEKNYAKKVGLDRDKIRLQNEIKNLNALLKSASWLPESAKKILSQAVAKEGDFFSGETLFDSGFEGQGPPTGPQIKFFGNAFKFAASPSARVFLLGREFGRIVVQTEFAKRVMTCFKQKIPEKEFGLPISDKVSEEIFADWFGQQMFAEYLKQQNVSPEEKRQRLRNAFRSFCGLRVNFDGTRPANNVRVNFALSHPDLNAIACYDSRNDHPTRLPYCAPE